MNFLRAKIVFYGKSNNDAKVSKGDLFIYEKTSMLQMVVFQILS